MTDLREKLNALGAAVEGADDFDKAMCEAVLSDEVFDAYRSGQLVLAEDAALAAENEALRAQAAQVRKEALEAAAIVAQNQWERWNDMSGVECEVTACQNVAAAIRALIEKEDG